MDATYTAENSKRKEGSTNEKRRVQLCTKYKRWSPFSNPKSKKCSMSPASTGRGRKVRGVQTKKDRMDTIMYKQNTND